MQRVIRQQIKDIKIVHHKHNGRIQRFSVYVPQELLAEMQAAFDNDSLWDVY